MTLRGRIAFPKGQDRANCDCVRLQQRFAAGEMGLRGQVAWHHPEPLISANGMVRPCSRPSSTRSWLGVPVKEHAMSQKLNSAIAVIGIDIGKNSFHLV